MSDTHTSGPWEVLHGPEWEGFTVSGLRLVAKVHEWGFNGEAEANARLIAAAPELLAALEDIVASSDANCGDSLMNAIQAALAAIAKAKGA